MNNILVTGSDGQLGSIQNFSSDYENNYFFTCKGELDITKKEELKSFIEKNDINIIINCAAYTAVDKAEDDEKLVDAINHKAVKNLAKTAKEKNIKLIHVSTDYVFDGKNYKPYDEEALTNPQSIYGRTKLDGEKSMIDINPANSIIIRTSWVYSNHGSNFVKTMLKLGKQKEELNVVFDQVGTPTYAGDLAKTILDIIPKIQNSTLKIYHYSNEGVTSWYDFAKEIMKMAKIDCKINPIQTSQYPTPAKRPYYSLLNKAKIKKEFNMTIPFWKDSLEKCLRELGERK